MNAGAVIAIGRAVRLEHPILKRKSRLVVLLPTVVVYGLAVVVEFGLYQIKPNMAYTRGYVSFLSAPMS